MTIVTEMEKDGDEWEDGEILDAKEEDKRLPLTM